MSQDFKKSTIDCYRDIAWCPYDRMNRFQKGLLDIALAHNDSEHSGIHGKELEAFLTRYDLCVSVSTEHSSELFVLSPASSDPVVT